MSVEPCANHPSSPASRRCVRCARAFCRDCALPTTDGTGDAGYGVCDPCRESVPPHQWNRFAAGMPDHPGDHLADGILRPRKALMRAAFGALPWGGLVSMTVLGLVGASWVWMQATVPEMPGGVRFGRGIVEVWEIAGVVAVFALSMHALQPGGPGPVAPVKTSLGIFATAGLPASVTAALMGFASFALPLFLPGALSGKVGAAVVGLATAWTVGSTGRGLALRRGAAPGVGVAASAAGLVLTLLVLATAVWLRLNPPWGDAWTAAEF